MARKSKHGATCAICNPTLGGSRRPVGRVHQLPDGWAVTRWSESEPIVSGLGDKRDGFLVLFALKHGWRTVSVRFRRSGERERVTLDAITWQEGTAEHGPDPEQTRAFLRARARPHES